MRLSRLWVHRSASLLILGSLMLLGCVAEPVPSARLWVTLWAETLPRMPLAEVRVTVDGELRGQSDENGLLQLLLTGRPGQKLELGQLCPDGYRSDGEPTVLQLPTAQPQIAAAAMELRLRCAPLERTAAFVVLARGGSNLPVLMGGTVAGRTDEAGFARFSMKARPGAELSVKIDTSGRPALRPQNPVQHFVLGDEEGLFAMVQPLRLHRVPKRRRAPPPRIIRIE